MHGRALLAAAILATSQLWQSAEMVSSGEALSLWLAFKMSGDSYTYHALNGTIGDGNGLQVCGKPLMVLGDEKLFWISGVTQHMGDSRG